jgi:hypothetical protein
MVRTREESLQYWRNLREGHPYPPELVERVVNELEAEVFVLEHQGHRSDHHDG